MSLVSELTEVARELRGVPPQLPTQEHYVTAIVQAERAAGQMADPAGARRLVRALVACDIIHVSGDAGSGGAA